MASISSNTTADSAVDSALERQAVIPYMLEAFMAGDRGFRKGTTVKHAPPKLP